MSEFWIINHDWDKVKISAIIKQSRAGLRWIPAPCCAVIIFILSATPGEEVGQSYDRLVNALQPNSTPPSVITHLPMSTFIPKLDLLKVGHGIGYFLLGLAVLSALPAASRWSPGIALLLCSLYAVTDEFHQLFVPGRSASTRDILIDSLAALCGVAILLGVKAFYTSEREADG